MTPKREGRAATSSALDHCTTFSDTLLVLARKRQARRGEKLETVIESIPLSVRNWKRIIAGEVVPSVQTFNALRRALCENGDHDKFDAMFIQATTDKTRFSSTDVEDLIEFGSGIKCSRSDTLDPQCFRAIVFYSNAKVDTSAGGEKAMAYCRSLRSLVASKRLPARSDTDRQIRLALLLHREAWVARAMNKLAMHEQLLRSIEALGIDHVSAYIRGSVIDHRLLATNNPEDIVLPMFDRAQIDAHVAGFTESLALFKVFDSDETDPLRAYGIESVSDDAEINLARYACMYGRDEAARVLTRLKEIRNRDEARGAPRFLTIYNDLVETEALIAFGLHERARELIELLMREVDEMGRSDLAGELGMLKAKSYLRNLECNDYEFDCGIESIKSVETRFLELGNDVRLGSVRRVLMQIQGIKIALKS